MIVIPPIIPAVVGFESNVYFDGVLKSWNRPSAFNWDVTCGKGRHDANRWRLTPLITDVGSHAFTVSISSNGTVVSSGTSSVKVVANTVGQGVTRKVLVIGDSLTAGGVITQTVLDNLALDQTSYSVEMIGSLGTAPNKHEARSGWSLGTYYTHANSPFVFNGVFDFGQYLTAKGLTMSAGDSVFIELGVNDMFSLNTDGACNTKLNDFCVWLEGVITSVQTAVPGCNVWVCTLPQPADSQDAFGNNYLCGQPRDRYVMNCGLHRERIINQFKNRDGNGVRICPMNHVVDSVNNYPTVTEALNGRNAVTVVRQSNGVHPTTSGYRQLGDLIYSCLMSLEQ